MELARPLNNSYYPKVSVTQFFRMFEAPISQFQQDQRLVVYVTCPAGCDAIVGMWHICENLKKTRMGGVRILVRVECL